MRKLKTFPALGTVRMPKGAAIMAVHPRPDVSQAPALLVEYDDQEAVTVERQFITVHPSGPIPPHAGYVASWREGSDRYGPVVALYERFDADVPADLDPERHADYRLLISEGYTLVGRMDVCKGAWKAPVDQPPGGMSREAMEAVARLQEHGYGPVVA